MLLPLKVITNTKDLLPHETDRCQWKRHVYNVSRAQMGQKVLGEEWGPASRRRGKES